MTVVGWYVLTSCSSGGCPLLHQWLDIVAGEQADLPVELPLPPFSLLLAQYGEYTALVEAELVRGLRSVGVESKDHVL